MSTPEGGRPSSEGDRPVSTTEGVPSTTVGRVPSSPATPNTSTTRMSTFGVSVHPESTVRRSARSNKGQYNETRYINEVFLASVEQTTSLDEHHSAIVYQAELEMDMASYESNITDP